MRRKPISKEATRARLPISRMTRTKGYLAQTEHLIASLQAILKVVENTNTISLNKHLGFVVVVAVVRVF